MNKQKILISGAGPAGLALALLLNSELYDVTVIESGQDFSSIGFAIILWKTGYEILEELLPQSPESVYPINEFNIYGGSNLKKLKSVKTQNIGHSIKRSELIRQLSHAFMDKYGRNAVRFSSQIVNLEHIDNNQALVKLNDGSSEAYDLVVLADGMHSQLRGQIFSTEIITQPYKITYAWIKSETNLRDVALLGYMKNYVYLIQAIGEDTLLAYYNSSNYEENEVFLRKLAQSILTNKHDTLVLDDKNIRNFTSECATVNKAFDNNVVLIGDSYHGHPPTFAMGTSMALEDAYKLSQDLNALNSATFSTGLEAKLKDYTTARQGRINEVFKTQNFFESFLITDKDVRILFVTILIKFGGWPLIEKMLLKMFAKPMD